MASDDEDVPESGAVFTFGKTRFADNLASKFWIRDDPVVQVACGDEHSAIITAKGKLYTFGSNDWGQLGHGNTKPYNKPSVVKKLKPEKSYLVACGRNHTLVATESGRLYSFGCGQDGQLGHDDSESCHDPKAIESLDSQRYSRLACGSDFSVAVTADGILYTWGSSGEGQNGLGEDAESPKRLYLAGKVISVACGYYHMAVVTDDGSLYTCGEKGGKLGLEESQLNDTSQLQKVEVIKEKVISVSCGSEFTAAVTQTGHVYSFGQGNQGQLGLGSALTECELPEKLQAFDRIKAKNVECGESFTAIVTKHGNLYTFGDGRHGKLGLGDECFSNLFKPQKVTRFNNFIVKKVSCGGCHMLVSAVKKEESVEESDSEEQVEKETLMATMKPRQFLDAVDGPSLLSSTWSARDKRRQKNVEDINNSLSHSLPPINKSSLPPLNGTLKRTLPALGKINLNEEEKKPVNPLNVSKLPQITHPDGEEDNQTTSKSQSSPKSSPRPLPRGHKPTPLAAPRALPRTKKEKEETESEEESGSEEESEEEKDDRKTKKQIKEGVKKTEDAEKEMKKGKQAEEEESEEEDEEEESETDEDENKKGDSMKTPGKDKIEKITKELTTSKDDEDDGEEEEDGEESEEQDEDDDDIKNKKKSKDKVENIREKKSKKIEVGSSGKKGEKGSEEEEEDEEEEEESEDDKDAKKTKTKKDSKEDEKEKKSKKGKKKSKDDKDKDEDKGDKEATEESTEKTKKTKKKGKKKEETKQEDDDDEEEEGDKDDDKNKDEDDKEKTDKDKKDEGKETPKNAAKQKDKKSGICVML